MQLAFSTNAYTRFPLDAAIRGIAKAGFEGVEILADVPHAYPDQINPELIDQIRRALDETNLRVSNVNANCSFGYWRHAPPEPYFEPSLISPNAQHRADRQQLIMKTLDFARKIGARNISITSGRCLGGMPPHLAARQFEESIKPILARAEQLDVNVGIECEPGLFIEWAAELREWIDRMNSPRLGANWDVGHSVVMGENIAHAAQTLAGRIWNLHVEDLPGRKHYHTIPGDGTFEWSILKRALDAIDYDLWATVELYTETADPQSAAEQSFSFLSNLFG
jgi:sugar phosphate isomerase/epimerase